MSNPKQETGFVCPLQNQKLLKTIDSLREAKKYETQNMKYDDYNRKIFEHFLIIGVPPDIVNEDDARPELLFLYPSNDFLFNEYSIKTFNSFCFPDGVSKVSADIDPENSIISEFIIELQGSNCYFVCCHSMVNPVRIPFFASIKTLKYPFCYCFITKNSIFSVHFEYLFYFTKLINRIVDPACKRHFKVEESIDSEIDSPNLIVSNNFATWKNTHIPRVLKREMYAIYHSYKQTSATRSLQISLSNDIKIVIPQWLNYNEYIGFATFDTLFSLMTVPDIVTIFTALLLDFNILFYSKNLNTLSLCTIAMKALSYPFELAHSFIPILPMDYLNLMDNPAPFVIGVHYQLDLSDFESKDHLCYVNLDKRIIECYIIPPIPDRDEFINKITEILESNSDIITVPDKSNKKKYTKFIRNAHVYSRPYHSLTKYPTKYIIHPNIVRKLMECFSNHLYYQLEDKCKPYFVSDTTKSSEPVSIFDKDSFLLNQAENFDFYKNFVNTMTFGSYISELGDKIMKEKTIKAEKV